MKNETKNYFSNLSNAMTKLISGILTEPSRNPFKRIPQVRLGLPTTSESEDFHVTLLSKHQLDSEKGTFTSPLENNSFLVFRSPVQLRCSFLIMGYSLAPQVKLAAFDKLSSYFFDTKILEPVLPDSYKEYPALYKKLCAARAEIRANDEFSGEHTLIQSDPLIDTFQFSFDYVALYHSGNPLREDRKVTQRVVDFTNEDNERRVL